MKVYNKIMGVILGIMLIIPAMAQQTNLQEKQKNRMKTTIDTKYRGADYNSIQWQQKDDGNYDGSFDLNGRELTTTFDAEGNWKQTSETMSMDDLPASMRTSLSNDYQANEISGINRVETSDNKTYYDITVNGRERMRFDNSGNPIDEPE